jgi:hypothetical protein
MSNVVKHQGDKGKVESLDHHGDDGSGEVQPKREPQINPTITADSDLLYLFSLMHQNNPTSLVVSKTHIEIVNELEQLQN